MFRKDNITFDKSTSPSTKNFIVCGDCGVGVVNISRLIETLNFVVFPVGSIIDYHAPNINSKAKLPLGWALCDGSTYDTTSYNTLFKLLGKPTLPNLVGKVTAMKDSNEFGLLSDVGQSTDILGVEVGVEDELMTVDKLPFHTHNYVDTRRWGGFEFANESSDGGRAMLPKDEFITTPRQTMDSDGGVTPIPNRQPTITVLKIIKLT